MLSNVFLIYRAKFDCSKRVCSKRYTVQGSVNQKSIYFNTPVHSVVVIIIIIIFPPVSRDTFEMSSETIIMDYLTPEPFLSHCTSDPKPLRNIMTKINFAGPSDMCSRFLDLLSASPNGSKNLTFYSIRRTGKSNQSTGKIKLSICSF